MEVQNCKRCGRVFSGYGKTVCPTCEKEEELLFRSLKDYIDENRHCTLQELSDATQVPPKRILRFIRDGRIAISDGMKGEVLCEQCGKPISKGRYCDSCIIGMNAEVEEIFGRNKTAAKQERQGAKMRSSILKKL